MERLGEKDRIKKRNGKGRSEAIPTS